jgi:hypothetical protein
LNINIGFHKRDRGAVEMSIYDSLRDYLKRVEYQEIELAFPEIEEIIGRLLPKSAERPQWWANTEATGHTQRESWRAAGFDAFLIAGARRVKFRRIAKRAA